MGDSLEVIQGFPKSARVQFGRDLRRLQIGETPLDSKPIRTVGQGVRELRARDRSNRYRAIYVLKHSGKIFVLHAFVKKTRTTSKSDIDLAKARLKKV